MDDLHEELARKAFRPHSRPLLIAVLANALLFGGLVVFPWTRGQVRAADARERFASFAACFWGGEPHLIPGLELPAGERERYAANVLHAADDWPRRCRAPLAAVAPDEPFLLFPGVKQAEEDVRAAVELVDGALAALGAERGEGVGAIPHQPLLAVGRLLASLSALHQVAGVSENMRAPVVAFEGEVALVEPARVPLFAALDAVVGIQAAARSMEATAVDARGISRVRVSGGRVDARRVHRPSLVRGTVRGPRRPWVTWAMAPARCRDDEHRCATHAIGLAPLPDDATATPEPRWYAGHPSGRIDRVVRVDGEQVLLVAVGVGPSRAELRRFPLGGGPSEAPAAASLARPLPGFGESDRALILPGRGSEPPQVLFSAEAPGEETVAFRALSADGQSEPADLAVLRGRHPFAFSCDDGPTRWLALGTDAEIRVLRLVAGEASPSVSEPLFEGLRAAVSADDPQRDRLRLACDADRADVVVLDEEDVLLGATCGQSGRCQPPMRLRQHVAYFDVVRSEGETLVAWAPRADVAEVHVARFGVDGLGPDAVPTPCWQSAEGFCGAPRLAAHNGRFLLAARERTDLLVVESTDGGQRWQPMRGVR